jgi:hypothetical protein
LVLVLLEQPIHHPRVRLVIIQYSALSLLMAAVEVGQTLRQVGLTEALVVAAQEARVLGQEALVILHLQLHHKVIMVGIILKPLPMLLVVEVGLERQEGMLHRHQIHRVRVAMELQVLYQVLL